MTSQQTGSTIRRSTPLLSVALAIAFAACGDAPSASIVDVDVPVPGDPAIYAPDGWPLRIGDRVTDEDRDRLRKEFLSPYQWAPGTRNRISRNDSTAGSSTIRHHSTGS